MARYVDIECDTVSELIGRVAFKSRDDIQRFLDNIISQKEWQLVCVNELKINQLFLVLMTTFVVTVKGGNSKGG